MVLLTKWILENNPDARVVIVTDRDELDKQIKDVFTNAGEEIKQHPVEVTCCTALVNQTLD